MEGFPLLTPEEARSRLPALRPVLARLREAFHAYKFAKDQADEIVAMSGATARDSTHPDHEELERWSGERDRRAREIEALIREANALGADVKDPVLGLVDFFSRRGDRTVLLCFRDDEDTIGFWHPIETGFAGRRPLSEL